jgi:hypothetical protein
MKVDPWPAGASVAWRSRPEGSIGTVIGCRVVVDDPTAVILHQPTGAPVMRRVGERGGPRGRTLLPGTWTGQHAPTTWNGSPSVRLHPIGEAYSVIRTWDHEQQSFVGWYVNLERPWQRTQVGFDSRDDVLDVVVSDDLERCSLKDEDELDFAVEIGVLDPEEAQEIRHVASRAMAAVEARWWPFDMATWAALAPPAKGGAVELPESWDQP